MRTHPGLNKNGGKAVGNGWVVVERGRSANSRSGSSSNQRMGNRTEKGVNACASESNGWKKTMSQSGGARGPSCSGPPTAQKHEHGGSGGSGDLNFLKVVVGDPTPPPSQLG